MVQYRNSRKCVNLPVTCVQRSGGPESHLGQGPRKDPRRAPAQTMKTTKNLRMAASIAAIVLLSACASKPTIGFESNQEANYSGFKTYALLPLPQRVEGADPGTALRVATPLSSEIKTGMSNKGYREAPPEQATVSEKGSCYAPYR